MELNEYQELAARTDLDNNIPIVEMQKCFAMGLAGEAGETVDIIKKHFYHKRPLNPTDLLEELGDTLWYLSMLALKFNISLQEIAIANIAKLAKRYPQGFVIGGGIRNNTSEEEISMLSKQWKNNNG
jgi:NTP pyrophosphatase (non-canonical NTP hydrolase)